MAEAPGTVIYHNPACGTSRNVLALLRAAGAEPQVVEYLVTPLSRETILRLARGIGLPLRAILRRKGTPYAECGLDDPALGEAALLDAIAAHPILLNRPIVESGGKLQLCRPSDVVLDLLPEPPARRILKEDGTPFLRDVAILAGDGGLQSALAGAGLPIEDLGEPNRTFFAYDTLDGERLGYGGFERFGDDVLIRSVAVAPGWRGRGAGSGLVALLLFRAQAAGARTAYLLTTSAAAFFAKLGFAETGPGDAPPAILSTRQAAALCPASAQLMSRSLGF